MVGDILSRIAFAVFLGFNFLIYEFLNQQPRDIHVIKIQIEESIPFLPFFSIPYILFVPLLVISLVYFVFLSQNFYAPSISFISCQLIANVVYTFYQTTVTRPDIISSNLYSSLVTYIYSVDRPYNCFPSLHVSLSLICLFYWTKAFPIVKLPLSAFVFSIILSTVFIKQHYILDVVGGISLAILSFYIGQVFFLLSTSGTCVKRS